MFTGIVTDIGTIKKIEKHRDTRLEINSSYDSKFITIGSSISCSGVCLTVTEVKKNSFIVGVSEETISKTTISNWYEGDKVNLERSLKVGDELGGHIVTGHIDGVAQLCDKYEEGDSLRMIFKPDGYLLKFISSKGSVTIDGVSLTVNQVLDDTFGVNIINHTQKVTTLGKIEVGSIANIEIDIIARYLERLGKFH
tara:strand:- start:110 stop:697 length:588 start_codon:yes stop_codon:yes gene_type:complete